MKETGLQGKACMVPVTVAAVLGMAGMGLMSERVVKATDITSVTDTLSITVNETCTFRDVSNLTFTGSALSGAEVENFNNSGVHEFNIFCNSSSGYTVSATPYDLETTGGIQDKISYTDQYTPSGRDGLWTAEISSTTPGVTVTNPVPVGGGVIVSSGTNTSASGTTFTATYSAYVGSITPAGTYTGRIEYSLSSLSGTTSGGSNNSGNNSGTNTNNDNNGGGEEPGETEQGDTGQGDTNGDNSGNGGGTGDNEEPSNTEPTNNSLNLTPQSTTLNNSYSTYNTTNTYNTYNTTNYSGGSTTTPTVANATPAATSDSTSDTTDTTSDNSGTTSTNDTNVGDNYEKPLGVNTVVSSSSGKSSETMDPMPIVATGALTMAGVAALALARSGKKEEE